MLQEMVATSSIVPGLYLGSQFSARNADILDEMGITHIVQVTHLQKPVHRDRFEYLVIAVDDQPATNLLRYFDDTFAFIDTCIEQGGQVLVHCMAGISRSSTIVIAYLMRKYQWSVEQATTAVRQSRTIIKPNTGFRQQLALYEEFQWTVNMESPRYQECIAWCTLPENNSYARFCKQKKAENQVASLVASEQGQSISVDTNNEEE
ncbi:protein-tyrosine phosphatase-like protein [Syncephalis plumigaleata]|nr:protein-tyrosine phosphatase-like protein [Syncephalis plumigaleata]